jgi:hypothetical protein
VVIIYHDGVWVPGDWWTVLVFSSQRKAYCLGRASGSAGFVLLLTISSLPADHGLVKTLAANNTAALRLGLALNCSLVDRLVCLRQGPVGGRRSVLGVDRLSCVRSDQSKASALLRHGFNLGLLGIGRER